MLSLTLVEPSSASVPALNWPLALRSSKAMTRNWAAVAALPRFLIVAPSVPERVSVWLSVTRALASSAVTVRSTLLCGAAGGGTGAGAATPAAGSGRTSARVAGGITGRLTSVRLKNQQRQSRCQKAKERSLRLRG